MLEMSQSEYARHRGVSRQAISKLAGVGKLVLIEKENGDKVVDVAASDRALGEVRERIVARDEPAAPAPGYTPPAEGGLTKAKTATEIYRARLAQLDYDEKVGRLLQAEDVARAMRVCGEAIARDIELLPNAAAELAAALRQDGEAGMRLALKKLSRQMLTTLAANMRLVSAPPAAPTLAPGQALALAQSIAESVS